MASEKHRKQSLSMESYTHTNCDPNHTTKGAINQAASLCLRIQNLGLKGLPWKPLGLTDSLGKWTELRSMTSQKGQWLPKYMQLGRQPWGQGPGPPAWAISLPTASAVSYSSVDVALHMWWLENHKRGILERGNICG